MKKLSLYVFLALMFCNAGITQELIKIPVHVHIVQIEEGDYKTITTPEDVREDFKNANWIWAQANIFWDVVAIDHTEANTTGFSSETKWISENYNSIEDHKKKDKSHIKTSLRRQEIIRKLIQAEKYQNYSAINLYYLPKLFSSSCATTGVCETKSCRKNNEDFVVIGHYKHEKGWSCLEPAGELTAHELGHMLGLRHEGTEGKDLMKWGAGQIITKKTAAASRKYYNKYLKKKLN